MEPERYSEDEFYLLVNGSLFVPYSGPNLLNTKDYCMETFYNETNAAGVTLPMVCFQTPLEETKTSATLIAYATGTRTLILQLKFATCLRGEIRSDHRLNIQAYSLLGYRYPGSRMLKRPAEISYENGTMVFIKSKQHPKQIV